MAKKKMQTGTILMAGFASIIFLGAILLYLPFSHNEGVSVSFLDTLFVAVSAVCVTGLTPVDIATTFSLFGRIILLTLVEVGGLGFATFAVFVLTMLGKSLGFGSRSLAQDAMNMSGRKGIVGMARTFIGYAFAIEAVGAVLLAFPFAKRTGSVWKGIGMGIFHSISAFNNAGFDLMGDGMSLMSVKNDVYTILVVSLLIFLGGIGFMVLRDILHIRKWSKFPMHTKIVLSMSFFLTFGGMLLLLPGGTSLLDSFFLSVSARTAGFTTVALENLSPGSTLIMCILMLTGASPGSTGGGMKTTTLFVILMMMVYVPSGRKPVAFRRRIPADSILKAFAVMAAMVFFLLLGCFLIMTIEGPETPGIAVFFEAVSAVATVGLSMSLTGALKVGSRIVLMCMMFVGRLGPLTIAAFLVKPHSERIEYVEENILIG